MKETIEHNNRFYGEELKTESEQLKEWLIVANKEIERLENIIKEANDKLEKMQDNAIKNGIHRDAMICKEMIKILNKMYFK